MRSSTSSSCFRNKGEAQFPIAPVQRSQHQIRGTGRAEHCHRVPHPFRFHINIAADMQIGSTGQPRQHLMCRVAAVVRPQLDRVTPPRQKRQMCSVGIVHQQLRVIPVAQFRQTGNIRHTPQIVRRSDIDTRRSGLLLQCGLKIRQIIGTGQNAVTFAGIDPLHRQVQQHTGIQKCPMHISRRQHRPPLLFHQQKHGLNAEGRAAAGIKRIRRSIERSGIPFTLRQNALGFEQAVRTGDFRQIQCRGTLQRRCPESALGVRAYAAGQDPALRIVSKSHKLVYS